MQIHDVAAEAGAISLRTLPGSAATAGFAASGDRLLSLVIGGLTVTFLLIQIGYAIWKWLRNRKLTGLVP